MPYFEGGAVKEYPGGYTVVRLYETGYMVNFYKTAAPECRAWSERSRGEYLGLYPYYTLGASGPQLVVRRRRAGAPHRGAERLDEADGRRPARTRRARRRPAAPTNVAVAGAAALAGAAAPAPRHSAD